MTHRTRRRLYRLRNSALPQFLMGCAFLALAWALAWAVTRLHGAG